MPVRTTLYINHPLHPYPEVFDQDPFMNPFTSHLKSLCQLVCTRSKLLLLTLLVCLPGSTLLGADLTGAPPAFIEESYRILTLASDDAYEQQIGAFFECDGASTAVSAFTFMRETSQGFKPGRHILSTNGNTVFTAQQANGRMVTLGIAYSGPTSCDIEGIDMRHCFQQPGTAVDPLMTTQQVDAVIGMLRNEIEQGYILSDVATRFGDWLNTVDTPSMRISQVGPAHYLTRAFRDLSSDRHFQVHAPEMLPWAQEHWGENSGPADTPDACTPGFSYETTGDNIGLITIHEFLSGDCVTETLKQAMEELQHTRALVVDVRLRQGGDGLLVEECMDYLHGKPTLISVVERRISASELSTEERWSEPRELSSAYAQKPVYVLTSSGTFSAGEAIANGLRNRATTVGETTAGGGHGTRLVLLPDDFSLALPYVRVVPSSAGEGWEGSGVTPDVAVSANEALERAVQLNKQDSTTSP
jgi:hypothetical protein